MFRVFTVIAACLLMGTVVSTSRAADCNFENGVDVKVFRFAWPAAVGMDLGVVDFEVGKSPTGILTGCLNLSGDGMGLICMIPRVGDYLGPMCPQPEDEVSD